MSLAHPGQRLGARAIDWVELLVAVVLFSPVIIWSAHQNPDGTQTTSSTAGPTPSHMKNDLVLGASELEGCTELRGYCLFTLACMWSIFRRKNRDATRLEFLDRFGRDEPEDREVSAQLRRAIALARDEARWPEAVVVFQAESDLRPDFDVPYLWLADHAQYEGRTREAITVATDAAKRCRQKSGLLAQAAEFALFSGEVRESVHLFAQSIAALDHRRRHSELEQPRAFLFMAEFFEFFGDARGARWARRGQYTDLDDDCVYMIRNAVWQITPADRARLRHELPEISRRLRRLRGLSLRRPHPMRPLL